MRAGDVIVAVGGQSVQSRHDLFLALGDSRPGSLVQLTLLRDGRRMALDVRLGERPADLAER